MVNKYIRQLEFVVSRHLLFFILESSSSSTVFLPDHVVDFVHKRRPLFDAVPLLLPFGHQKVGRFYSVRRRQNVTDPVAQLLAWFRLDIRFVPRHLCWTPTCERETIIKHFKLLHLRTKRKNTPSNI